MPPALSPSAALPMLIDVHAVAELLGCSDRHVYRLSETGRMPKPRKLGALCRWSRAEVEAWIAGGCPAMESKISEVAHA